MNAGGGAYHIKEKRHVEVPRVLRCDDQTYELCSCSVHRGEVGEGHYIAVVRDPADGTWRKMNDSNVSTCPADEVDALLGQAFMLFYAKQQAAL